MKFAAVFVSFVSISSLFSPKGKVKSPVSFLSLFLPNFLSQSLSTCRIVALSTSFQPGNPEPPRWLIKSGVVGGAGSDDDGGRRGGGPTSYRRWKGCKSRFLQGNLSCVAMGTQGAVLSQVFLQ
ncbi:hypothetical protein BDP81DRAFT_413851 [Colletotrichum phormii]|uniref:Uncharacterized protein n=1 Tax=Colletotrichum phormii TaxID=359342 RepID=A0AAJ0A6G4_9PEZI|nr:uncharacterized protein BDP81DRAFT_413851 [Colletotrichum phormii]KAK1655946.1 hypothetical protein BDP81DRAFT_413851 [Colletotrichum phormii]